MTMSNRPETSSLWQSNIAAIGNPSVPTSLPPPPMALDRHISAASAGANHLVVSFDDYESLCGENKNPVEQPRSLLDESQQSPQRNNNPRNNNPRRSMPSDAFGRLALSSAASAISPVQPPSRRASWAFDPGASVRKNAAAAAVSLAIEKRKSRITSTSRRDSNAGGTTSSGEASRELMQNRIRRARSRSPTANRPPRGETGFETPTTPTTPMTSFEASFASPRDFMLLQQQDSSRRSSSSSRLGGAERSQPSHPFGEAKRASDSAPYSLALTAALNVASNTVASNNAILASRSTTAARRGSQQTMSAVIKVPSSSTTANTSTPRSNKIQPLHHLEHKKSSFSTATTTSMSTSGTHSTASCTQPSPVTSPVRAPQPKVLRGNSFESVQRLYEIKSRHNLVTAQVSQESRAAARSKAAAALERANNNESSRSLGRRSAIETETTTPSDTPFGNSISFPSFHGASSSREPSEVNSEFPETSETVLPQLSPRCVMLIRQRSREQLGCEQQQEEVKKRPKRRDQVVPNRATAPSADTTKQSSAAVNRKSREVDPDNGFPSMEDLEPPATPRRKPRARSVSPSKDVFDAEKRETPRRGPRGRIRRQGSRDDVTGRRKERTDRSDSPTRNRPLSDRQASDPQLAKRKNNNTPPATPKKTNVSAILPRQSSLNGFRSSAPRARTESAVSEDNALFTTKASPAAARGRAETALSEDNVLVGAASPTAPKKKKVMVLVADHAKLPFDPDKRFRIITGTEKEEPSKSSKKRSVPRPNPLRSAENMSKGARPATPPLPSRMTRLSRRRLLTKQQSAPKKSTPKKPSEIVLPDDNPKSLSTIDRFNESGDLSVLTEPTFTGLAPFSFDDNDFGDDSKERYETDKFYESGDLSLLTEPTFEAPPAPSRKQQSKGKQERLSVLQSSLEQLVQQSPRTKASKKDNRFSESFEPSLGAQSPKYSSDDFMRNSLAQQLKGGFHDSGEMSMLTDPTFGFPDDNVHPRSSMTERFQESGDMSLLTEPTFEDFR